MVALGCVAPLVPDAVVSAAVLTFSARIGDFEHLYAAPLSGGSDGAYALLGVDQWGCRYEGEAWRLSFGVVVRWCEVAECLCMSAGVL